MFVVFTHLSSEPQYSEYSNAAHKARKFTPDGTPVYFKSLWAHIFTHSFISRAI